MDRSSAIPFALYCCQMITVDDYFEDSVEHWNYTPTDHDKEQADDLLTRVNAMLDDFGEPRGCNSGHRTRAKTDQLRSEGYGAVHNDAHERACGIDIADPDNDLDAWLDDTKLASYGLYREDPGHTHGWVHVQNYAPGSGHRTFIP